MGIDCKQELKIFLNNCGKEDFSQIPYASIRMYEGTPERVRRYLRNTILLLILNTKVKPL